FFHPDWAVPICVAILGTLLVRIVDISLGFLAYKLYVETIRLPFPLQGVDASLVETVVGRPADRMRVLIISAVIGIGWGLLAYGAPLASAGAIQLLPLPFASLNRFMERIFPGSSFGISIDLMAHCVGLLLPFWTSISIFLGSLSFYTIGNGILVSLYPEKPAGIFGWTPGMDIMQCYQWSNLYIWSSVTIGLGLAAGLVPLLKNIKVLLRAFSRTPIGRSEVKVLSPVPIWIPIATWAAASIISVVLTAMLVPGFPVWILVLLSFGWTPISVLIVGRMLGETSLAPTGGVGGGSLFYVREAAFIGSGYQHIDIWYAPLVVSYGGGHGILAQFKVCELTGTKLMSIVKGLFFAYPIAWLMSFLLVQLFWLIAPIPSAAYPMAMATWPFSVTMSNIMVSGFRSFFRPELATTALVIGVGLQLAIDFFHLPFSLIGFLVGAVTMVPFGLAYLIGGIAGKIMAWRIGNEKWNDYKVVIVAGIILGGSIVASTAAAIGLISKAKWVLPY
ncbi:MAG: OPT/YSL family transporter, partial [Candidatus Bathyarchaeia archaeon]